MKYGIAKHTGGTSDKKKIMIVSEVYEFMLEDFVGVGARVPKTYKSKKHAEKVATKVSGYVFEINEKGVMNY